MGAKKAAGISADGRGLHHSSRFDRTASPLSKT